MSTFKCYGGNGADLGTVRLLSPATFPDFVKETLGHAVLVNVTRAQFAAMDKKQRNAVKRVSYVTPACFKTDPCQRLHENATTFCLVALDIDDPAQAAPFTNDPAMLHQQLAGLQFAAYTTASSTPEAPRLRIFAAANNLPVQHYAAAVHTVAQLLGLPTVTKESLICVQPMFLPTIFKDDAAANYHPLIANALEGDSLQLGDLSDGSATTAAASRSQPNFNVDGDDLDYLRPTVEGIEIADIADALEKLDPDVTYPEWLEVAAALRHQFPYEPEATQAYELFDEWSAKGSKYVDADDTMAKWKSLRANPRGRAPVTIRTILHKAQEQGWESSKLSTKCYANTLKWMTTPERVANDLMSEGIKRIAATPLLSPLERGTLLSALQDALKAKGLKVQRTELKKELTKLERQSTKLTDPKSTPDAQLPAWCRGMCYVAQANEFFHRATNRALKPEAYDNCYNVFLTEEDSANAKPTMLARDFSLNLAKIPRVDNYRYDPAHPEQAFVHEHKHKFINTYLPTYPEPTPGDAQEAGDIFLDHITQLIAEEEYQQTLVDWLAYQVQNPGAKIRWAVVIQGAQGCGKTAIAEAMAAVMGSNNVAMLDASLLMRDMFNGWAMGSQIVAVEEIRVVGHNRHEVMNKLKPCISNDRLSIRVPFKAPFQHPNNVNYIMFTNHHDSLAVSADDRRYFVVNSAIQNKAQVAGLGVEHFNRLFQMFRDKAGGLRQWFLNWDISKTFQPDGHAPATRYLSELMRASATPLTAAVSDAIGDADHPLIKPDLISSRSLKTVIETQNLPRFTDQNLASVLRELDYIQLGRYRVDEERHYLWIKRGGKVPEDPAKLARQRLKAGPHKGADGSDSGLVALEK